MPRSDALSPLFEEFPPLPTTDWNAKIEADLGADRVEEVLTWSSAEGLSMPAYLRREDWTALAHADTDGRPRPLQTQDTSPAQDWRIRQDLQASDPAAANRQARRALRHGITEFGLTAPANTASDGLSLSGPGDLDTLVSDLPADAVQLHLDGPAAPVLGAVLPEHVPPRSIASVTYDPVGALAQGTLASPERAFSLAAALTDALPPEARTITVDGRVYHEAGAAAVQELGSILAALSERLTEALDRGRSLSEVLGNVQICTALSTSYFLELAKLRALRLLVPQVVDAYAEAAGAGLSYDPEDVFIQAGASARAWTPYDPHVNLLRGTTEAMAAVQGGCDVLTVPAYDAALRDPDAFSSRIARNTQLILKHESHFDAVADPGAGSYYIEGLTDRLAEAGWAFFQSLEADGGILACLRDGSLQTDIGAVRAGRFDAVNHRDRVLVGTNHYPYLDEPPRPDLDAPGPSAASPADAPRQMDLSSLSAVRTAFKEGHSLSALTAGLAEGEGPITPLPAIRLSEQVDVLRRRTERYANSHNGPPTVLLAPLGPAKARSARATFARNALGVAGFEIESPLQFESTSEAADRAVEVEADIVVLCSGNDAYAELTPSLRSALDARDHTPILMLAGTPAALPDDLDADAFVYQGAPLLDLLETLQEHLGIQ